MEGADRAHSPTVLSKVAGFASPIRLAQLASQPMYTTKNNITTPTTFPHLSCPTNLLGLSNGSMSSAAARGRRRWTPPTNSSSSTSPAMTTTTFVPAPAEKGIGGFMTDFLMGGVSAAVSKTAAAPIERVKLLVQNQDEMLKSGRLSHPYRGIGECFTRTVRDEGTISLWRGNMANVVRYFPTQVREEAIHSINVRKVDGSFVNRLRRRRFLFFLFFLPTSPLLVS